VQTCILVIERNHRVAAMQEMVDRRLIHRDDLEFTVAIAIKQPDATAHGLQQISHLG
jgi:hypothetical protein